MLGYTSCQHASCWVGTISSYGCWCFSCHPTHTPDTHMSSLPNLSQCLWLHLRRHTVSTAYSSLAQGLSFHTAILLACNPHLLYLEQFRTFFVHGFRFWMCGLLPKTREVPGNGSGGRTKECHFCPLSLTAWGQWSAQNRHLKGTSWVKKAEK